MLDHAHARVRRASFPPGRSRRPAATRAAITPSEMTSATRWRSEKGRKVSGRGGTGGIGYRRSCRVEQKELLVMTDAGLHCPAGGFHIDPWRPVPRAVITHAHGDHARP